MLEKRSPPSSLRASARLGASEFLTKPVDFDFLKALRKLATTAD
jgi:hypothetical protein